MYIQVYSLQTGNVLELGAIYFNDLQAEICGCSWKVESINVSANNFLSTSFRMFYRETKLFPILSLTGFDETQKLSQYVQNCNEDNNQVLSFKDA